MLSLYYHKSISYQSQHRPTLMRKDQQGMESNDWIHFKRRNHQIEETLLYTFDWRVPAIKQNGWLTSGLDIQIMWLLSGLSRFDYIQFSFIDSELRHMGSHNWILSSLSEKTTPKGRSRSRWPTQNKFSSVFLEVPHLIMFCLGSIFFLLFPCRSFACILWLLVYRVLVYVNVYVSPSMYIYCAFSGAVFLFFVCLLHSIPVWLLFISPTLFLNACLYSNESEKERVWIWMGEELEKGKP